MQLFKFKKKYEVKHFQVFRLAGRVVGVELQRDKEGKSRGFAVVVYDHPVEAVQAISMLNNQQLFDRYNRSEIKLILVTLLLQETEREMSTFATIHSGL